LRLFPVWHIGTDYLQQIAIAWYQYLVDKGVKFMWETEVEDVDFENNEITIKDIKSNEIIKISKENQLTGEVIKINDNTNDVLLKNY
jgi:uncharacterized FAD-dependent dehydrogenase